MKVFYRKISFLFYFVIISVCICFTQRSCFSSSKDFKGRVIKKEKNISKIELENNLTNSSINTTNDYSYLFDEYQTNMIRKLNEYQINMTRELNETKNNITNNIKEDINNIEKDINNVENKLREYKEISDNQMKEYKSSNKLYTVFCAIVCVTAVGITYCVIDFFFLGGKIKKAIKNKVKPFLMDLLKEEFPEQLGGENGQGNNFGPRCFRQGMFLLPQGQELQNQNPHLLQLVAQQPDQVTANLSRPQTDTRGLQQNNDNNTPPQTQEVVIQQPNQFTANPPHPQTDTQGLQVINQVTVDIPLQPNTQRGQVDDEEERGQNDDTQQPNQVTVNNPGNNTLPQTQVVTQQPRQVTFIGFAGQHVGQEQRFDNEGEIDQNYGDNQADTQTQDRSPGIQDRSPGIVKRILGTLGMIFRGTNNIDTVQLEEEYNNGEDSDDDSDSDSDNLNLYHPLYPFDPDAYNN